MWGAGAPARARWGTPRRRPMPRRPVAAPARVYHPLRPANEWLRGPEPIPASCYSVARATHRPTTESHVTTSPGASAPHDPAAFFAARFGIDAQVMAELLGCALGQGGDYADLYFEYRQTGSLLYEEQSVKRASGGVLQGVGVRVVSGDATGYAYTEDFSRDSMRRTAGTAARIARSARAPGPLDVTPIGLPNRYPVVQPSIEVRAADKLELLAR